MTSGQIQRFRALSTRQTGQPPNHMLFPGIAKIKPDVPGDGIIRIDQLNVFEESDYLGDRRMPPRDDP